MHWAAIDSLGSKVQRDGQNIGLVSFIILGSDYPRFQDVSNFFIFTHDAAEYPINRFYIHAYLIVQISMSVKGGWTGERKDMSWRS